MSSPLRLVVMASGRGSNLRSIVQAIDSSDCSAEVVALVTDKPGCEALSFARERNIPTASLALPKGGDRAAWNQELALMVSGFSPELVVLAGFMKIVSPDFLHGCGAKVINVHPSLLPAFRGKDAPAQAIAAGVTLAGCTVHLVNEEVDAGAILAQAAVPVLPTDSAETLHQRIQVVEHKLFPLVIEWVSAGRLSLTAAPHFQQVRAVEGHLISPDLS